MVVIQSLLPRAASVSAARTRNVTLVPGGVCVVALMPRHAFPATPPSATCVHVPLRPVTRARMTPVWSAWVYDPSPLNATVCTAFWIGWTRNARLDCGGALCPCCPVDQTNPSLSTDKPSVLLER